MPFDDTAAILNAVVRTDYQAFFEKSFGTLNPGTEFQDNWHLQAITHKLNLCASGEIKRLIIQAPPRFAKSQIVSVAFPAYLLGRDPTKRIIVASYGDDLAKKLSNDTRSVVRSKWYCDAFPGTQIDSLKDTESWFKTTREGARYATTVGGSLTGLGGDVIIIDDPLKAQDAFSEHARNNVNKWFDQTVRTRLDNPKQGLIIVVMQRLHEDDLVGHLLEGDGWDVLKLPARAEENLEYELAPGKYYLYRDGTALHPERLDCAELKSIQRDMGTAAFYAQFQQSPVPAAGNLFNWEWFKFCDVHPPFSELFLSVDVAASLNGNYSAATLWGHRDRNWYLCAAYRFRYELADVRKRLYELDKQHRPDVVIVDGVGVGRGLVSELRDGGMKHVVPTSGAGKEKDAWAVAPKIESGHVFILSNAPGLADFRHETIAFPNGKYNDQVDSMVQILKLGPKAVSFAQQFKRSERAGIASKPTFEIKVIQIGGPRRLVRRFASDHRE